MGQIDDFFTNYFYRYFSISYVSNMKIKRLEPNALNP